MFILHTISSALLESLKMLKVVIFFACLLILVLSILNRGVMYIIASVVQSFFDPIKESLSEIISNTTNKITKDVRVSKLVIQMCMSALCICGLEYLLRQFS